MSRSKETSSAAGRKEEWLGNGLPARGRPWALEQQLLGTVSDTTRSRVLDVLNADLADERAELARLEEALHERAVRVARLEWRLNVLEGRAARGAVANGEQGERPRPRVRTGGSSLERDYWLCRCEGFWVDTPEGRLGLVEGLRFLSRIDKPDLLEVRAGLLGRKLLLVPSDHVEEIVAAEGRLVLREMPRLPSDHLHMLLARLRRRRPVTL